MKILSASLTRSVFLSALACLALMASASPCRGEAGRCAKCGMDISKYPHTRYEVETTDGKTHVTCGVQCGLTLHLRLGHEWKRATATDLLTNKPFDASQGYYVFKSSVVTDMAPGFVAFKTMVHAQGFAKGFGGQVGNYQEALEYWKGQMNR